MSLFSCLKPVARLEAEASNLGGPGHLLVVRTEPLLTRFNDKNRQKQH
ncbi:MAG: hypothetical protein ABFD50_12460 [Smithella sp.]